MGRIHQENKKAILVYCKKEVIMNFHNKITASLSMATLLLTGCSVAQVAGPIEQASDPITGMEFVAVPGGCFQMGAQVGEGFDDEKPVHEVCVDGFSMGKYEVTQGEWEKVMGHNPSYPKNGGRYPVNQVMWIEAQKFIAKLNSQSGRQYRLPTEAEWEYAARSGAKTNYSWGNEIGENRANGGAIFKGSPLEELPLLPVGSFPANSWGLHDMHGNVFEWCSDWYDKSYYQDAPRQNPQGPSIGSDRVYRGGSWFRLPRVSERDHFSLYNSRSDIGFRLAFSSQGQ